MIHVAFLTLVTVAAFVLWSKYQASPYCQKVEWRFWNREPGRDCRRKAAAERKALLPYIADARSRGWRGEHANRVARTEKALCEREHVACEPSYEHQRID